MSQDPFVILGVDRNASQAEILEAYKTKRSQYSSHVFDEGESGAEAARRLEELDNAYQEAMEYSHENATVSGDGNTGESFSSSFDAVKNAIKNKQFDVAQQLLDDMNLRDGEWHYYQAIIYYEKSWLNESKRQLEMALAIDPNNAKYQKALDNMKRKIDGTNSFEKQERTYAPQNRTYAQRDTSASDGLCAACEALWCADCCCECMGGDLIRCC